jgi:hypothetical protein
MKRYAQIIATVLLAGFTACDNRTPSQSADHTKPGENAAATSQHEKLASELMAVNQQVMENLFQVSDIESAKRAAANFDQLGSRIDEIAAQLAKLTPPDEKTRAALSLRLEEQAKRFDKGMGENLRRKMQKAGPDAVSVIQAAYFEVFAKMEKHQKEFDRHFKVVSPLEMEAEAFAEQLVAQYWVKSGETFLGTCTPMLGSVEIFEVKGFFHKLESSSLSEADKLNGIQWRGKVIVTGSASRRYDSDKQAWGLWQSRMGAYSGPREDGRESWYYDFEKNGDQWKQIKSSGFGDFSDGSLRLGSYEEDVLRISTYEKQKRNLVDSTIISAGHPFEVSLPTRNWSYSIRGSKSVQVLGLDAAGNNVAPTRDSSGRLVFPQGAVMTLRFTTVKDPAIIMVKNPIGE